MEVENAGRRIQQCVWLEKPAFIAVLTGVILSACTLTNVVIEVFDVVIEGLPG